jgi:hypothetical protein
VERPVGTFSLWKKDEIPALLLDPDLQVMGLM